MSPSNNVNANINATSPGVHEMEIQTHEYERSHARAPRGRGSWAFWFGNGGRVDTSNVDEAQWFNGTYAEARRRAVAYAVAKKFDTIVVGS